MKLPNITKKQQEILDHIPQFRFIDRTHIQHLLHHKDKQQINKWLTDLTNKKYIEKIYDNKIIGKYRIPSIYYLATNGRKYMRLQHTFDDTAQRRISYEKDRSEGFITHCLLVASICCSLNEKNSEVIRYDSVTKHELVNQDNPYHFLIENGITTDLIFTKKQKGEKLQYFILELFDTTLPRYRVKKRIRNYIDFYFSNEWEDHINSPFPKLLFVFQTKAEMIYAKRYVKSLLEEHDYPEELLVHTALAEEVKEHGVTGEIWEKV